MSGPSSDQRIGWRATKRCTIQGLTPGLLYRFGPNKLSLAPRTIERFVARAIRLYEQEPGEASASSRLGLYVRRWVRWARSGVTLQHVGWHSCNPGRGCQFWLAGALAAQCCRQA